MGKAKSHLSTVSSTVLSTVLFAAFAVLTAILAMPIATSAAPSVWACGSSGIAKDSFYTNDTVYACGNNLTANVSGYIDIYIVNDTSTWTANASLNDVSTGYQTFLTNATGDLPPAARWPLPRIGSYDMVADTARDGKYNSSDYVDSTSAVGFSVTLEPKPTLTFAEGPRSPASHTWDLANKSDNIIMQLKATAYENEDITLNSISLTASGSGDDKTGIKYVKLIKDVDGNGAVNATDKLLAYNYYLRDNGITMLTIDGGERILLGNSTYFIIAYVMSDSAAAGDTFKFQVTAANAVSATTSTAARITGLPFDSAVTTISGAATTTTIAVTTTTTQATTTLPAATTTTLPATEGLNYYLIIGALVVVFAVIAVAVYFLFRRKKTYSYEELGEKWGT